MAGRMLGNRGNLGRTVTARGRVSAPVEPVALPDRPLQRPRRARSRRALLPLLVLAAAAAAFAAMMATRPAIQPEAPAERVWAVEAATVTLETTRPRIPLFGQAVAGRSVDLRPLVAGRVAAVGPDFREGGFVGEGDLLIAIDPFDFETARALRTAELAEAAQASGRSRPTSPARATSWAKTVASSTCSSARPNAGGNCASAAPSRRRASTTRSLRSADSSRPPARGATPSRASPPASSDSRRPSGVPRPRSPVRSETSRRRGSQARSPGGWSRSASRSASRWGRLSAWPAWSMPRGSKSA